MNTPKKHHYVPRFLLRRFALAGTNRLYVFDKATDKVFPASIEDIAAENRLYDFTFRGRTGSIEEGLSRFESMVAMALATVLETDSIGEIDPDDRDLIGAFVAQLMLRSPHSLARQRDLVSKARHAIQKRGYDPDSLEELRPFDRNEEKMFTALTLSDNMLEYLPAIVAKDWSLQAAPIGCAFYISDNPVAFYNRQKRPGRGNLGLRSDGIEVFLPISTTRCLAMRCTSIRERLLDVAVAFAIAQIKGEQLPREPPPEALEYLYDTAHGTPRVLQAENVTFCNSLQVSRAERFVYSTADDFELVRLMLRNNPGLRTGPRLEVS